MANQSVITRLTSIRRFYIAFLILIISLPTCAQSAITLIAGTGIEGYSGEGELAIHAQLNRPTDVAIDSEGLLYIADTGNHRIRKITADGIITTIAGDGTAGYNGDMKPARSAQVNSPSGIVIDAQGNLYIADQGNHRIRKIDSKGITTTIVGTVTHGYNGDQIPAHKAQLSRPTDIVLDAFGNLYIADTDNHRIRKVDVESGLITTVVGTGVKGSSRDNEPASTAKISLPTHIAVDKEGNLYLSDPESYRIRQVNSEGIINTVVGNGSRGYSGDTKLAIIAQLNYPSGLALNDKGHLYLVDQQNYRIRKVTDNGIITTIAGNGIKGYSGDEEIPTAARINQVESIVLEAVSNVIYLCDTANHRIRRIVEEQLSEP